MVMCGDNIALFIWSNTCVQRAFKPTRALPQPLNGTK
jgi:rare lipoprotein A